MTIKTVSLNSNWNKYSMIQNLKIYLFPPPLTVSPQERKTIRVIFVGWPPFVKASHVYHVSKFMEPATWTGIRRACGKRSHTLCWYESPTERNLFTTELYDSIMVPPLNFLFPSVKKGLSTSFTVCLWLTMAACTGLQSLLYPQYILFGDGRPGWLLFTFDTCYV